MGHEGCCGACVEQRALDAVQMNRMENKIDEMQQKLDELHKMAMSLAESFSAIGDSAMGRSAMKAMGFKVPVLSNGDTKS